MYVDYLAQLSGGNGLAYQMYSTFYTVTPDGYVYRVELNGLDPNGYIFYGNRMGFLDPDGITPLYHDVTYPDNNLSAPVGGVILPPAEAKIFFNDPRGGDLPVSILPTPAVPSIANVSYEGTAGGATGYRPLGGTFTYSGNVGGISEIIIQGAGSSDFEPDNPLNRRLLSSSVTGSNSVTWDGRDNSGNFFPVGTNYPFRVIFHSGEYHFPLLDAENSPNGGPTLTLLNPINGVCPFNPANNCRTAFYDDRGYRLSTGAVVGTVGATLPGDANAQNPPAINRSDQNDGFDTATVQRTWGNGSGSGFGNWKALDLWTYFPVSPVSEVLNVIDPPTQDLRILKTHTGLFNLGPAGGAFSITVSNVGTAVLNGAITVTDSLPAGLTPVSATTPGGWNACSIVGQTVTCVHPNPAGLAIGAALPAITLTVDVAASAAPSVTNTATVANANDSNPDNNQSDDIVNVNAPELSVNKTDSVSGSLPLGPSFNWTLTAANTGTGNATFAPGQLILRDPLPANATYGAPAVSGIVNVNNPAAISCAIDGSNVLTCTASGAAVTLGAVNGSFLVAIPVTPTAAGSLANTATIDPNSVVLESNEGNNTGSDTVAVVSIDAVNDSGTKVSGTTGGQSFVNVLVNDLLNGDPALLANVILTQVSTTHSGVTLNPADSSVNVAPGTPVGNYTVTYQICDALFPTICDTATVTVPVGVIDALDDSAGPVNGLSGALNVLNVFGNDTLDGSPAVPTDLTLTETIAEPNGYLTLNLDGSVDVNPGTPAGSYQLTYQICETAFPALCDTAVATVTVVAAPIVATDDSAGPVNGLTGAANVLNVFNNDTLNALPVVPTDVNLSETIAEPNGYLTLNPDGSVDVNPGTPSGVYQLTYQICEILNPTNCDTAVATVTVGVPGLSVDKVVTSAGPYPLGATITYTLTATNTGTLQLTNVTIADNNATLGVCTPAQPAALAPNASLACAATYVVSQPDIDIGSFVNTATADSTETPPVNDTETINFVQTPAIDLVKTGTLDDTLVAPAGVIDAGDAIDYTLTATNTGNTTLSGVSISDPLLGALSCIPAQPATLAPGAALACTASYILTQADVDAGIFNNTAAVTGNPPTGGPVTDTDGDTQTLPSTPVINLVKTGMLDDTVVAPAGVANAGDVIGYTLTATNTTTVTLSGVTISDPLLGALTCTPAQPAVLAPGDALACTAAYTLTQADVDAGTFNNTAAVTGNPPTGSPVTDTDGDTQTLAANPSLAIDKAFTSNTDEDSSGTVSLDDTLTFTVTVTNTGNTTQTGVTVSDPRLTPASTACAVVAPNATCVLVGTHVVTQTEVDAGQFVNTASGSSTEVPSPVTDTVTTPIPQNPGLDLVKTGTLDDTLVAPAGVVNVGDVINYTLTATNTGNTTLSGVTISDPLMGALACVPLQPAVLAPGDALACTASYALTQADVDAGTFNNTAAVTGNPPTGTPVTDTDGDTQTLPSTPGIDLVKTGTLDDAVVAPSGVVNAGDVIHYTLTATNTGTVTLTGVTISDALVGPLACVPAQPATLIPGAALACTASYALTQPDVDAGNFSNTAAVTGNPPTGSPVTDTDGDTQTMPSAPAIDLVKTGALDITASAPIDAVNVGDVIHYTLTATNTGNTTLSGVTISDPLLGALSCTPPQPAAIDPGGALVCTGTYTLTLADINTGSVSNSATAMGNPPKGNPISDGGGTITSLTQAPAIGLAKRVTGVATVSTGTYDVTFAILVRNYGNVTLANLLVVDDLNTTFPAPNTFTVQSVTSADFTVNTLYNGYPITGLLEGSDSLAPGASGTITLVVRVVPAGSGPFINSANTSGVSPAEEQVEDISQNGTDPDTSPSGDPADNGDGDPTNNNDPTPVSFDPHLFDPPFGIKTFRENGLPIVEWSIVWINDSNLVAIHAASSDPIPAGTTYVASGSASGYPVPVGAPAGSTNLGVACIADPASTQTFTSLCYFEGPTTANPRGRIVWQGTLGPDTGATDEVSANDEIRIRFELNINEGTTSVRNTATVNSDLNGDGDTDDAGETMVADATTEWRLTTNTDTTSLPNTGFPPAVTTVLPPQLAAQAYTAFNNLSLEIPTLGVQTSIVGLPFSNGGWNATWLGNTAGWLGGTAFPTWKGNSVVTAHVYNQTGAAGPFVNLNQLKFGDRIIIHIYGQRYVYEVRSSKFVRPDDTSVLSHKDQPWLTLLTCREFDEKTQSYLWRLAVQAVLVSVEAEK